MYHNAIGCSVHFDRYAYSKEEAERLKDYPRAQYAYGLNAWARLDIESAGRYFRQSVTKDPLFIDGWLRLAEVEKAMGNKEKALEILNFTIECSPDVYRWKWPQMLLARDLGLEEVVSRNANYLLSRGILKQDTLQFLHTYFSGNASAVVSVMDAKHLSTYLDWLMKWSMTEKSLTVWHAMADAVEPEKETALRYADFLLHKKRIDTAKKIWRKYTGPADLTNPGFETEYTGKGFDWCYWNEEYGNIEVMRVKHDVREGDYSLRLQFNGRENIDFHHYYQIFATDPLSSYRLTYAWKSHGITTDQGFFMEILGYDAGVLYASGPQITGTHGWREESIEFVTPEKCRAGIIRLRRLPSLRFDSKIRGTLWLDDFRLEKIDDKLQQLPVEMKNSQLHPLAKKNDK